MFTGIVSELATVAAIDRSSDLMRIRIAAPATATGLVIGDSIAVNGVCLTVVDVGGGSFEVEIVHESLARSTLGALDLGDAVNLERPMAVDGRFDGHIVQGHVDGVGIVASLASDGGSILMRIGISPELATYVVEKGSITVDGASLTITGVSATGASDPWFDIALIPHTLSVTTLGVRTVGDRVNLEVDVIAKYVERMLGAGT